MAAASAIRLLELEAGNPVSTEPTDSVALMLSVSVRPPCCAPPPVGSVPAISVLLPMLSDRLMPKGTPTGSVNSGLMKPSDSVELVAEKA